MTDNHTAIRRAISEKPTEGEKINRSKTREGVSFTETDSVPKKDDPLHFSELGISSIELGEEEQSKLAKKKEILAVEEDTEVHFLRTPDSNFALN